MRHTETIPVTCIWCDVEIGRYIDDKDRAIVHALAKAHDLVCPNHPGWIEVKALQEKLRQAEADLADARREVEKQKNEAENFRWLYKTIHGEAEHIAAQAREKALEEAAIITGSESDFAQAIRALKHQKEEKS